MFGSKSDSTKNADSFAQLAIIKWTYGLSGGPYDGPSCVPQSGALPVTQKRAANSIEHTTPRSTTAAAALALTGKLAFYTLRVIGNYPDPK